VQVAGVQVPLPADASLQPGQTVTIKVLESGQGLQLRIVPQASVPAHSLGALEELVAAVLESLGAPIGPELPSQLVPANLPQTPDAVRALLALFVSRGAMGEDLRQIAALVEQAVAAGALPRSDSEALLARIVVSEPGDFHPVLEQLADAAGHTLEARIAMALAAGNLDDIIDTLRTDLRAHLARLRENPVLQRFLQRTGQLRTFETAVDRVLERLVGAQLQNLRGLEQPYLFLEVPCSPDSGIQHAQVHVFSEGHGKKREFDAANALVAFDLATTRLGDLWITLRITQGRCLCRFCATRPAAVDALTGAAHELVQALEQAGHHGARVEVALWDADRLRETAALMRRFSGINVQA